MFRDILSAEKHFNPSKSMLWVRKLKDLFTPAFEEFFTQFL
jgi:hypothetical protein